MASRAIFDLGVASDGEFEPALVYDLSIIGRSDLSGAISNGT
jgi:hypothetical protein